MPSLSYHHLSFCTNYKTTEKGPNKESHKCVKINGINGFSQVGLLSQDQTETVHLEQQIQRLNIPRKRQYVDPYRQGIITEEEAKDGVFYRQTIVVRSCEVGPDRTATIESILNLLQVMFGVPGYEFIQEYWVSEVVIRISIHVRKQH